MPEKKPTAITPESPGVTPRYVLLHNAISRSAHNLSATAKKVIAMAMALLPADLSSLSTSFTFTEFCKSLGIPKGGETFRLFKSAIDECVDTNYIVCGAYMADYDGEEKARKARDKAESLHPGETWREIEERIFIAGSREPRGKNQLRVLEKELVQARILTAQGSAVYLLPEVVDPANIGVKHPDAVVDGFIMEFKTITGSISQIEHRFKESMKKAEGVFFKIDAPLSKAAVFRKIRWVSFQKQYRKGVIIAYFTETSELHYWDISEL